MKLQALKTAGNRHFCVQKCSCTSRTTLAGTASKIGICQTGFLPVNMRVHALHSFQNNQTLNQGNEEQVDSIAAKMMVVSGSFAAGSAAAHSASSTPVMLP